MDKNELYELMQQFERSGLQLLKLSEGDFYVELQKAPTAGQTVAAAPAAAAAAVAVAAAPAPAQPEGLFLKAPLVGTYYAAPSPEAAPYVQVGDEVKKGQTVCLIEAMKTMSEVPAPCDLVVEELLVRDGSLVAFDAPILRYRHV